MNTCRIALEAVKTIEGAIRDLIERGDLTTLQQMLAKIASDLGLGQDAFHSVINGAQKHAEELRATIAKDLQRSAEKAKCDVQYKPPYASVGCVTCHERSPSEWSLSILDGVVLDTIRTTSGTVLVEHAVRRIEEIESALERVDAFVQDLIAACAVVRGTPRDSVSANLLMVLCSHGRSLNKLLSTSENIRLDRGLSRAQFGYLLSRAAQRDSSRGSLGEPKLRLLGATQRDTKKPQRYVAVPENSDPRRITRHRLVTAVTVTE